MFLGTLRVYKGITYGNAYLIGVPFFGDCVWKVFECEEYQVARIHWERFFEGFGYYGSIKVGLW